MYFFMFLCYDFVYYLAVCYILNNLSAHNITISLPHFSNSLTKSGEGEI